MEEQSVMPVMRSREMEYSEESSGEEVDVDEIVESVPSAAKEVLKHTTSSSHTSTSASFRIDELFREIDLRVVAGAGIASFIVAVVVFVALVERKKAPRNKFLRWLREYLNFRSVLISGIIKFVYMFMAVFLTIVSVIVMCSGKDDMVLPMIGIGFAIMVIGNILLRVMLELTMALIVIWENTSDIRSVVVKDEEKPKEKEAKKEEVKEDKEKASQGEGEVEEVAVAKAGPGKNVKVQPEVKAQPEVKVQPGTVAQSEITAQQPVTQQSQVSQPGVNQ